MRRRRRSRDALGRRQQAIHGKRRLQGHGCRLQIGRLIKGMVQHPHRYTPVAGPALGIRQILEQIGSIANLRDRSSIDRWTSI